MALVNAALALILFVTMWAAYEAWLGPELAYVLIVIELILLTIAMVWSLIALTGPHTFIGKRRRKRQDAERLDRAVDRDYKAFNSHH